MKEVRRACIEDDVSPNDIATAEHIPGGLSETTPEAEAIGARYQRDVDVTVFVPACRIEIDEVQGLLAGAVKGQAIAHAASSGLGEVGRR